MHMSQRDAYWKVPFGRSLRYVRPALGATKILLLAMVMLTLVSAGVGLLPPYLGKLVIDRGVTTGKPHLIIYYGALTLAAYSLLAALRAASQATFAVASKRFSISLKTVILKRLLRLPMEFFDRQPSGYLVTRLNEMNSVTILFSPSVFQSIASIVEAAGALMIMITIGGTAVFLLAPFLVAIFLFARMMGSKLRRSSNELMDSSATTASGIQEVVFGISEVKNFDSESRKLNETLGLYREAADIRMRQSILMAIGTSASGFFGSAFSVAVMMMVGIYIADGRMTIGDYVALTGYAAKLLAPAQTLTNISLTFQPAIVALKRLGMIFESKSEDELWGKTRAIRLRGSLTFTKVSFRYGEGDKLVLDSCSFSVYPGESVAIVGRNGSGKTTILKLILGGYHNYVGSIVLDDTELHAYDLKSLRSRIGVVSQNVHLFAGTLRDNIILGAPDASQEEVDRVARLSGCFDLFEGSLDGVRVDEHGKNLSGGQRQATAIARCLLKNPDVLLFDEATTYLDNNTRRVVVHAMRDVFRHRTRVLVTHDREIAKLADRILLMEEGAVKELSFARSAEIK